jgi:hypothetical protein
MTPEEKKEIEFVTKTAIKIGVGILIVFGILITLVSFLK